MGRAMRLMSFAAMLTFGFATVALAQETGVEDEGEFEEVEVDDADDGEDFDWGLLGLLGLAGLLGLKHRDRDLPAARTPTDRLDRPDRTDVNR